MQRMDRLPPSRLGADAVAHGSLFPDAIRTELRNGRIFLEPPGHGSKGPGFDPRPMIPPGRPQICKYQARLSARIEPPISGVENRWTLNEKNFTKFSLSACVRLSISLNSSYHARRGHLKLLQNLEKRRSQLRRWMSLSSTTR